MAKEFAKKFYQSKQWKQCREQYIKSVHGLCERCLKNGTIRNGNTLHHINYLTPNNINDPNITLGWDNLELVCMDCHAQEHHAKYLPTRNDVMFDEQGNLVKKDVE